MGWGGGFARRIPSSLRVEPIRCPYARAVCVQWLEDGVLRAKEWVIGACCLWAKTKGKCPVAGSLRAPFAR